MPLQATSGAASYDAFGGGVPVEPNYIESVFQTYLYTGTGSTLAITNGVDLSTKGGLVWLKRRNSTGSNQLYDTARGAAKLIYSDLTDSQISTTVEGLQSFNSNGFTLGGNWGGENFSGGTVASWTFRKQPKFFDVVTYTGNITARTIAHNLGSVPGMIIVKQTSGAGGTWWVYHRSLGETQYLSLNETTAAGSAGNLWNSSAPTSTVFSIGANGNVNANGATYVAYLFAHDAGGFGLTGTDNVISCGSYTGNGSASGPTVTLGYEPQWVMIKNASSTGAWLMLDVMRGFIVGDGYTGVAGSADARLFANLSSAEDSGYNRVDPTSTGFKLTDNSSEINSNGSTYIYIAIRRGPMKVPTSGTSVFYPTGWTGSMATRTNTTGFVTDLNISRMWFNFSSASNLGAYWETRLTGATKYLHSDATDAEASQTDGLTSFASNTGITFGADSTVQAWNYDNNYRNWSFKRAPSFFDEVCYTGTGSATTVTHNLGVVPELIIAKRRDDGGSWGVYSKTLSLSDALVLNTNTAAIANGGAYWNSTAPTSSVFSLGTAGTTNASGGTYVAYLFATCAGVSKVGSYTGNGSSQTINCGFTAGARFVMVKATSTTGNWIVADTNSIASDRALYMNNADREVSGNDWIDIASSGFIVNQTATIAANTNGVTYIFLAIA